MNGLSCFPDSVPIFPILFPNIGKPCAPHLFFLNNICVQPILLLSLRLEKQDKPWSLRKKKRSE
nr:MAG TPA: hypothetical protein [Caudoviricetes sp.]